MPDAVVVGSGPNGLAAAILLAQQGLKVTLLEAKATTGGGMHTEELTLPGFKHDVGSAIHPFGAGSPFFRTLPLTHHGLTWVQPDAPLAHPLDDGVVMLEHSLEATCRALGADAQTYDALLRPLVRDWERLVSDFMGPLLRVPDHPLLLARFGVRALPPVTLLNRLFREERTRALFAGNAAHAMLPLESAATSAIALVFGMLGHTVGWPFPQGGAASLAAALTSLFRALGGEVHTGVQVESLRDVPDANIVMLDLSAKQLLKVAGDALPPRYRGWLERYRLGPGIFKVDYALDGPAPWRDPRCATAAIVHLGGSAAEIAAAERMVARGELPERPFVLVAQHSPFDATRAPAGKQTLWAYCHVPNGSDTDMTGPIEAQLERFAPGFRERVLARHTMNATQTERYNPNYVGGDINGGAATLWQLVVRPAPRLLPYRTPRRGVYLCSASTPPSGGVHGMGGYHAAKTALKDVFGLETSLKRV
ncbi:NAD(P)/FAD-dependent oxidoreductase [soil metagenome]